MKKSGAALRKLLRVVPFFSYSHVSKKAVVSAAHSLLIQYLTDITSRDIIQIFEQIIKEEDSAWERKPL